MNFEDIKNMSKKEFEQFMFNVQSSNKKFCVRCGNFTLDRITISVAKDGKSPRKLCNICKECYTSMLDYLGISDIEEYEAYMEDKIEIGEYVRTKNGIIDKVERFNAGLCIWCCENGMYIDECNCVGTHLENIVKHSKQLIDLIEVGDFVNEMEILHIEDNKLYVEWSSEFEEFTGFLKNKDIKTILTKEQYMANCYKVGGEDE